MTDIFRYNGLLISTGYFAEINSNGSERNLGTVGSLCMIEYIKRSKRSEIILGLRSINRNVKWPGNELLPEESGIDIDIENFVEWFNIIYMRAIVVENLKIGSENFKGFKGTVIGLIFDLRNSGFSIMMEFDECIPGGGCADGLGKYGHCLSVSPDIIDIFIAGNKVEDLTDILTIEQKNNVAEALRKNKNVVRDNNKGLIKKYTTSWFDRNQQPGNIDRHLWEIDTPERNMSTARTISSKSLKPRSIAGTSENTIKPSKSSRVVNINLDQPIMNNLENSLNDEPIKYSNDEPIKYSLEYSSDNDTSISISLGDDMPLLSAEDLNRLKSYEEKINIDMNAVSMSKKPKPQRKINQI